MWSVPCAKQIDQTARFEGSAWGIFKGLVRLGNVPKMDDRRNSRAMADAIGEATFVKESPAEI
jgi:hypothetical protein